ncbi:dTDP-4-dehydrorhamnose reductase [Castellaniella sp.]|uniref:dTDP-4-dehydrorhamnose reductase n=1 Tax=Castellaniella sp. TaxID=1955812 RepID=UPI002B00289E|nr:dTDP-4-dehydrorhamnose reductase [Castellaniella sp.]
MTKTPLHILVTGANGQLGHSLQTLAASQASHITYAFTDREHLDITDDAAVARWLDQHPADCLINAAAYTAVDRAATEPDAAMAINAHAPALLARHCAARRMHLLHVSTDYVFDGTLDRPYRVDDTPAPLNTYGRSKLLGEQAILQHAPDALILRTSWVFSAWGGNFVRTMLRLGAQRDHLQVIDDQVGGPTWAGHLAQALHQLALRLHTPGLDTPGGLYHCSGAPDVSWHGFAQEIFQQALKRDMLKKVPTLEAIQATAWPSPEPRPANSRLDCSRLDTLLGPIARDWRIGLGQVLDTWRNEAT